MLFFCHFFFEFSSGVLPFLRDFAFSWLNSVVFHDCIVMFGVWVDAFDVLLIPHLFLFFSSPYERAIYVICLYGLECSYGSFGFWLIMLFHGLIRGFICIFSIWVDVFDVFLSPTPTPTGFFFFFAAIIYSNDTYIWSIWCVLSSLADGSVIFYLGILTVFCYS